MKSSNVNVALGDVVSELITLFPELVASPDVNHSVSVELLNLLLHCVVADCSVVKFGIHVFKLDVELLVCLVSNLQLLLSSNQVIFRGI